MAQHDFEIDNQTAPAFRTDLNNALEALATLSSGATAPTTTYPNMLWYDTANNLLKMRTEADDDWITVGTLNQSTNEFEVANLTELTQVQAEDDTDTTFGLVSGERLGQAVRANSGLVPLATATASSDATIEFTAFDSAKYESYTFTLSNITPATDSVVLWLRTSTDGGATFDSGASDYKNNDFSAGGTTDAQIILTKTDMGSGAGEDGFSGDVHIFGPSAAKKTHTLTLGTYWTPGSAFSETFYAGVRDAQEDVDAVQFLFSSGNIESGTITMYGRLKA